MKRTPLFDIHQKAGGKLIEFGGWEMPVQYTSIMDEHLAVRRAAGVFDISHMGEVIITGEAAETFLNQLLCNDVRKLAVGQGQYTLMCNYDGGVVDDLYLYRTRAREFLLIINASRIEPDVEWMNSQLQVFGGTGVEVRNVSDSWGALAVQGPKTVQFIDDCFGQDSTGGTTVQHASQLKKNELTQLPFRGAPIWISRTGYTGEDGFEIVAPAEAIEAVWQTVLEKGQKHGLRPAGLGARDTLRTEMCYPLYGHELNEITTPLEAGLSYFVSLEKPIFNGKKRLIEQKEKGVTKKLIAFKMRDKSAPPRPHYPILTDDGSGSRVGEVVSGTQSPSLGIGIGMGYVPVEFATPDRAIQIEIRGKNAPAVVTPKPLYRKPH